MRSLIKIITKKIIKKKHEYSNNYQDYDNDENYKEIRNNTDRTSEVSYEEDN